MYRSKALGSTAQVPVPARTVILSVSHQRAPWLWGPPVSCPTAAGINFRGFWVELPTSILCWLIKECVEKHLFSLHGAVVCQAQKNVFFSSWCLLTDQIYDRLNCNIHRNGPVLRRARLSREKRPLTLQWVSVCPSVCVEQLGRNWTDFGYILYW